MQPAVTIPENIANANWWSRFATLTAALVVAASIAAVATANNDPGAMSAGQKFVAVGNDLRLVPMALALFSVLVEPPSGRRWAMVAMAGWVLANVLFAVATQRALA